MLVAASTGTHPYLGIGLGIMMGLLSGLSILFVFRGMIHGVAAAAALKAAGWLLTVPGYLFGGPWITTSAISSIDFDTIANNYVLTVSIVLSAVLLVLLVLYLFLVADDVRNERRRLRGAAT